MGHSRIGTLPRTRGWDKVVEPLAQGADVPVVASATLRAAELAFAWVQEDAGFRIAAQLMTEIGLAASTKDPVKALADLGIKLSDTTSTAEVAVAVGDVLDKQLAAMRQGSDFGEKAGAALVSAVVERLKDRLPTLIPPTPEDVGAALKGVGRANGFGQFARSFFGRLTNECLGYFLTKILGTKVGEGQRFATNNQMAEFMGALKTHCYEVSGITEEFAGDWFSKHKFEEGGTISRKSIEGFAWYAMQKMRAELAARAQPT